MSKHIDHQIIDDLLIHMGALLDMPLVGIHPEMTSTHDVIGHLIDTNHIIDIVAPEDAAPVDRLFEVTERTAAAGTRAMMSPVAAAATAGTVAAVTATAATVEIARLDAVAAVEKADQGGHAMRALDEAAAVPARRQLAAS